jgi:hypothetical protein
MMWWVWLLIGIAIGVGISFVALLILVGWGMSKSFHESNCEKLRRLGERGFYKDEH